MTKVCVELGDFIKEIYDKWIKVFNDEALTVRILDKPNLKCKIVRNILTEDWFMGRHSTKEHHGGEKAWWFVSLTVKE